MSSANARKIAKIDPDRLKPVGPSGTVHVEHKPNLFLVPDQRYAIHDAQDFPFSSRLAALQKWGEGTHSFLTLYKGVKYFTVPGLDGYIPLTINNNFILIVGQPICDPAMSHIMISALQDYADATDSIVAAIPTGESGKEMLVGSGFTSIYVGKEPIYDLKNLAKPSKSIRQAIKRAKRNGLQLVQYSHRYRNQMDDLCKKWQDGRELPAMGFLFELRPFESKKYKKYFLVVDGQDTVQAFLACSPIYAKNGWYLEDLIREQAAPNGTTELLVTGTMEALAAEGYDMATLGLAPLAGLPQRDAKRPYLNMILRFFFNHLSCIYHFKALEHFKGKFKPTSWDGNYLCHYRSDNRLVLVGNLLNVFMPYDIKTMIKHKLSKWSWRK